MESSTLSFVSGGLEANLRLLGVLGTERISQLPEFKLRLIHDPGPLSEKDLDKLLLAPCAFTFGEQPWEVIHGILKTVELTASGYGKAAEYLATLVPSAWLLTLSKVNRIFQDMTVIEMAKDILLRYGLKEDTHFRIDVDLKRIDGKAFKREFCVQYEESDWDYLSRWLEHEGYCYWFEHTEENDLLVIADEPGKAIPAPVEVPFHEHGGGGAGQSVTQIRLRQSRIPARVVLKDYNYRQPTMVLTSLAPVDEERGFGTVMNYGEHFKDPDAGKLLAKRRAQQVKCNQQVFWGTSHCTRLQVGRTFQLILHFDQAMRRKFLVTALRYRIGQGEDEPVTQPFQVEFEAIPATLPFRPALTTPWPSIHGVIHAHIDADEDRTEAILDDQGRYRVKFPFDASGTKGGKSSRLVRMAQPYAGPGYGSHFPLHKGTEVLVAFMDGDPDRPVIVGSIPNPHTLSPSTNTNPNQSVIQTASGIRIEMEDR
jgi:type VI secretion system secreted protein VgrG